MPKYKYMSVDVISCLESIMKKNTKHYQSDFEYDRKMIKGFAGSEDVTDKTLLWITRRHGTYCFKESDVFVKGTASNMSWLYYEDKMHEHVRAYAIELTSIRDRVVIGNIYELSYHEHCKCVRDKSVTASHKKLVFENGERLVPVHNYAMPDDDERLGKFLYSENIPDDLDALQEVLFEEKERRDTLKAADFKKEVGM